MVVELRVILMVFCRDVWWNSVVSCRYVKRNILVSGICKGKRSLAGNGSNDPRVKWRSCPDSCGQEMGLGQGWMLIHRNNGSLAMFPQQKDLDEGESVLCIRRYFLRHPLNSQPSFTIALGHHSIPASVQISKCRREGKKISPIYWNVNCTAHEDKRNNVTSENRSVYSPRCTLSVECVTPLDLFFFLSNKLVKISAAKWNDIIYPFSLNSHVRLSCLWFCQCPVFITFPIFVNGVGTVTFLRLFRRLKHIFVKKP